MIKGLRKAILCLIIVGIHAPRANAQRNISDIGAWYMYFWNAKIKDKAIGFQGDVQHRNWNLGGDLEQLLLRGGVTYSPNKAVKFTLGYGHITTGTLGTQLKSTTQESRIYQEALLPHQVGNRVYLTHRFRFEQRFAESQNFRTRFRYNIFMNIALNQQKMQKGTFYLALYNELFINGQRRVSPTNMVQYYDRNRLYSALGYHVKDNLKIQLGFMNQTTNTIGKNQLQASLHHTIAAKEDK